MLLTPGPRSIQHFDDLAVDKGEQDERDEEHYESERCVAVEDRVASAQHEVRREDHDALSEVVLFPLSDICPAGLKKTILKK